jgi:hypothetical protein
MVKMTNRPEKLPPHMLLVKEIWSKKMAFPGKMPIVKVVAMTHVSSVQPPPCTVGRLARLDCKRDLMISPELSILQRCVKLGIP